MLPKRDQSQEKRPTQTESEGLEMNFPSKRTGKKKSGVPLLISDKIDFQRRAIERDPEDHIIILKGRIHQEDINVVNIYAPNIVALKCIKKILEDFKKYIFFNFYCYSVSLCLFSPSLHPTPAKPTSLPHLHPPP